MLLRTRIVLGCLLFLLTSGVRAAYFADTARHPLKDQIDFLREHGIVQGYSPQIFHPNYPINRAEFLKILTLSVYGTDAVGAGDHRCFRDFTGEEQWFWVYACSAKEVGIIQGYPDGTFRGSKQINTVEALSMIAKAWQIEFPFYVEEPDHWYDTLIDLAATRGIYDFLPRFPGHLLTRAQAGALLVEMGEEIQVVFRPDGGDEEDGEPDSDPGLSRCGDGILALGEECDDGNVWNGDGCSQLCILVSEPLRHASLRIEQHERSATIDAVPGARGVEMLSFSAVAGRQNILLTGLKFRAEDGSLSSAQNFRILYDANGDGTPEKLLGIATVEGSVLTFSGLKGFLRNGIPMEFALYADLSPSETASRLRIGFAVAESDYIAALGEEDGRELLGIETNDEKCAGLSICWISVKTAKAKDIVTGTVGNLFVTKDPSGPRSSEILLGDVTGPILRFRLRATGEDIGVTSVRIGGGAKSFDRLELLLEGRSEPFATLKSTDCNPVIAGKFCVNAPAELVTVPKDGETLVVVIAYARSDDDGGTSGETAALSLSSDATDDIAFQARGLTTFQPLVQNDGDDALEGEIFIGASTAGPNIAIVGPTHDLVAAKIASIGNANLDSDGTPVPLGKRTIGVFRFTAAPNKNLSGGLDPVTITKLVFTVSAVNTQASASAFSLFNAGDPSKLTPCTADRMSGNITVTCSGLDTGVTSTVIEQGKSIDLALQGSIVMIDTTGDKTLQVVLGQLGDRNLLGTVTWEDDRRSVQWVDIPESQVKSTLYRTK